MLKAKVRNYLFLPALLITQKSLSDWHRKISAYTSYQNIHLSIASLRTLFATLCLSIFLVGCGGGGDDEGNSINQPPSVNAGSNQEVNEQTMVTLSGSGSDSDGSVVSYLWVQESGESVVISNATSSLASFAAPTSTDQNSLTFNLSVTDNEGATAKDTIEIIVFPINVAPLADAGVDQSVNEQTAVTLSGRGTDSDGSIASYSWAQAGGESVTLTSADGASLSFDSPTSTTALTLTFQLTVTDNEGATAQDTIEVIVFPINVAPLADAGEDQEIDEDITVNLTGLGSDTDGNVAIYEWTQISGETVTLIDSNTAQATFISNTTSEQATLTFELTVTDNEGTTTADTVNIVVNNTGIGLEEIPKFTQNINLILPSNIIEPLKLISQYSDVQELTLQETNTFESVNIDEVVFVVNESDIVVLMGEFIANSNEQEISSTSTSLVLVSSFPSIAPIYEKNKELFISLASEFSEVKELADKIELNKEWSLGDDDNFISAYADAVASIHNAIKNGHFGTSTPEKKLKYTSSIYLKNNVGGNITKTITISPSEGESQSGLTFKVTGETSLSQTPKFELSVDNSLSRYVVIVLGENQLTTSGKRSFLVGPESNATETYHSQPVGESIEGTTVYAFGPGQAPLFNKVAEQNKYYAEASLASIIEFQVIPTFKAWVELDEECLVNKWLLKDPNIYELIKSDASNLDLYMPLLLEGRYISAGVLAYQAYSVFRSAEIATCIGEKSIENLQSKLGKDIKDATKKIINDYVKRKATYGLFYSKLFGSVSDIFAALEDVEKIYSVSPKFSDALEDTKQEEHWKVQNIHTNNGELNIGSVNSYPTFGDYIGTRSPYIFDGECPEDALCAYFVYPRTRPDKTPFLVGFEAECKNGDGFIGCRNLVIEKLGIGGSISNPTIPLNGSTVSTEFSYIEKERTRVKGNVLVADYDGAYTSYEFEIQTEEATPNLILSIDDKMEGNIDYGFRCGVNDKKLVKTIIVENKGLGTYYFDKSSNVVSELGEGWAFNEDLYSRELNTNDKMIMPLEHDCEQSSSTPKFSYHFHDKYSSSIELKMDFFAEKIAPPIVQDLTVTVYVEDTLFSTLQATNHNSFEIKTSPGNGMITQFDAVTGAFTYQPADGFIGTDTFTFVALNSGGESNLATLEIIIREIVLPTVTINSAYDKLTKDDSYAGINSTDFYIELEVIGDESPIVKYFVGYTNENEQPTLSQFLDIPDSDLGNSTFMIPFTAEIDRLTSQNDSSDPLRATNVWKLSVWVADERDEISIADEISVNYGHKTLISLPFHYIPYPGDPVTTLRWYDTSIAMDIGPAAPVGWDGIEHHVYVSRSTNIINPNQEELKDQKVSTRSDAPESGDWWYYFMDSNVTSIAYYNFYDSNGTLICSNRSFSSYFVNWWCPKDKIEIDSITTLVVTY